jgi:hypothetical protein
MGCAECREMCMKDITINSMIMHLLVVTVFVTFAASSGGFYFYTLALLYICVTLKHAIDIANFEMSGLGETVRLYESGEYSKVDVYFHK